MCYPDEGVTPTNAQVPVAHHWLTAEQFPVFAIPDLVTSVLLYLSATRGAPMLQGVRLTPVGHSSAGGLRDAKIAAWAAHGGGGANASEGVAEAWVWAWEPSATNGSTESGAISAEADLAWFWEPSWFWEELDASFKHALAVGT